MHFSTREVAALLAGLRLLQGALSLVEVEDISTNGGEFPRLSNEEIDRLCERINFGENER